MARSQCSRRRVWTSGSDFKCCNWTTAIRRNFDKARRLHLARKFEVNIVYVGGLWRGGGEGASLH